MFAKWVGSGNHFAFRTLVLHLSSTSREERPCFCVRLFSARNQPEAGLANFMTLAIAMKPLLGKDAPLLGCSVRGSRYSSRKELARDLASKASESCSHIEHTSK